MKAYQLVLIAFTLVKQADVAAFMPTGTGNVHQSTLSKYPSTLYMAIDYNDPVVAAEFANVQPMDFDDVEVELRAKGIPVSAAIT